MGLTVLKDWQGNPPVIISQYGGPDGELAASLRYLSQRFGMPDQKSKAILNDIRN